MNENSSTQNPPATMQASGATRRTRPWNEVEIGALARFSSGSGISIAALHGQSTDFPVPVYGGNGIAGYTDRPNVDVPTVVVGRVGQRCGQVHMTTGPALVTDNALYPTRILRQFDLAFFGLALSAARLNDVKNRNDLPLVTQAILHAVRLPWPEDIAEQQAIAVALSDVDALLGALDRLIAKKRDLKQAAMQQLLTGQTRLLVADGPQHRKASDFGPIPENWRVLTFGELFDITAGGDVDHRRSATHQDSTHPFPIYSNAVTSNGLYGYCSYADHPSGSITITARGTLGFALFRDHPYTAIGRVLVLRPALEVDGRFFADMINHRVAFAIESTGVPQLTAPQISTYRLPVPPLAVQRAIATVLAEMQTEITALEQRRDKTRQLKQGMMQELLTGRIRLV